MGTVKKSRKMVKKQWELRLYIAGESAKAVTAFANLKKICEEHLAGQYHIEVIDLLKQPQLARGDQIVAVPTLIKALPLPMRRLIGDMSQKDRIILGLDLKPKARKS